MGAPSKGKCCKGCGQRIVGNTHQFEGQTYCSTCYGELIKGKILLEQAKEDLYNYIKVLFELSEIPNSVIDDINRLLKEGKKVSGIKATIWYYYEIEENKLEIDWLTRHISLEYENARKYMEKMKAIKEQNKQVDLSKIEPVNIVIKESEMPKPKTKIKYKMEDL